MTVRKSAVCGVLVCAMVALSSYSLRADVRADEKTHVEFAGMLGRMVNMFGGKAAREGTASTVAVKGDRMARLDEMTGQIIDLAEEKIYDLDIKKKSYKVTTFAEIRRRMEEARKKAEEDAKKQEGKETKSEAAPPPENNIEVDFTVKNTGEKKTINGFDTQEQVMTITVREKGKTLEQGGGMVLTSDMWITPTIKAMSEVAQFDMRYAQKLYGGIAAGVSPEQMAAAMAMYPMMKDALGKMSTEGAKLQGSAIQTVTKMDAVKSAEQVQQEAQQSSTSSSSDSSAKPTSVGGALGGMLARRMKKNSDENKDGASADKSRATFMTTTHEVLKVATEVAAGDVAVPAGFKESK
jgi:hypothetical protein